MTNEFVNAGSVKRYDSARGIALHYPISFVFFEVQINIRENPRDTWRISVFSALFPYISVVKTYVRLFRMSFIRLIGVFRCSKYNLWENIFLFSFFFVYLQSENNRRHGNDK